MRAPSWSWPRTNHLRQVQEVLSLGLQEPGLMWPFLRRFHQPGRVDFPFPTLPDIVVHKCPFQTSRKSSVFAGRKVWWAPTQERGIVEWPRGSSLRLPRPSGFLAWKGSWHMSFSKWHQPGKKGRCELQPPPPPCAITMGFYDLARWCT